MDPVAAHLDSVHDHREVAAGGQEGASTAVGFIQTEMDKTMAYTGCNRVEEISTDIFFGDRERNRMMAG